MKFKSATITQGSGSLGGMTFSHNRGGLYIRSRTVPVNTATARRTQIKSAFSTVVAAWTGTLTALQRGDWETYAAGTPVPDAFGDPQTLTGQAMFIRNNVPRIQAALPLAADAPATPGLGPAVSKVTMAEINVGESDFTIEGNLSGAALDDGDVLMYAGINVGPGVNYYDKGYQFVAAAAIASAAATFVNAAISYPPLGASNRSPVEDSLLPLRFRVASDDGRLSGEYREIVPVTLGVI